MLGETYVQASAKTIARIINDDPYRDDIITALKEDESEEH
jgi:hypothetical protein